MRSSIGLSFAALTLAAIAVPASAQSDEQTARCYSFSDKYSLDDRIAACTAAIQANSQNAQAYYFRGDLYNDLHKYDLALADYDQAVRLDPQYADAYLARGNTYAHLGQNDRAKADDDKACTLDSNYCD